MTKDQKERRPLTPPRRLVYLVITKNRHMPQLNLCNGLKHARTQGGKFSRNPPPRRGKILIALYKNTNLRPHKAPIRRDIGFTRGSMNCHKLTYFPRFFQMRHVANPDIFRGSGDQAMSMRTQNWGTVSSRTGLNASCRHPIDRRRGVRPEPPTLGSAIAMGKRRVSTGTEALNNKALKENDPPVLALSSNSGLGRRRRVKCV